MLFVKNLPRWERTLRAVAGLLMMAAGLWLWTAQPLLAAALAGSGVVALATGFVGWCPACAMVGRRLKSPGS